MVSKASPHPDGKIFNSLSNTFLKLAGNETMEWYFSWLKHRLIITVIINTLGAQVIKIMIKSKDDQYLVLVTMKIINVNQNKVNNLEYSTILFARSGEKMLNKIQTHSMNHKLLVLPIHKLWKNPRPIENSSQKLSECKQRWQTYQVFMFCLIFKKIKMLIFCYLF